MYNKVLVVSNMYPSKGFPSYGVFVRNSCEQLGDLGVRYDISVLTKTNNKLVKILKYILFYVLTFLKCLCGKYDLVYVHYPSFSARPVLIARHFRKFEMITNIHGTDAAPQTPQQEKMLKYTVAAMKCSKAVVVPSVYFKHLLIAKYHVTGDRILVYPSGGIDEKLFYEFDPERKQQLKQEYGVDQSECVIGFVSHILKIKGWDVFVDALEQCAELRNRKVSVLMVGSGAEDALLAERLANLPDDLKKKIIRFPQVDQQKLAELYNLMDVFVFPTVCRESLGLVAIEAMACGAPVFASDYAAPKHYVINAFNGYKFEKGNAGALAKLLENYLTGKADREALKKGAKETASQYSREKARESLKTLFQ